MKRLYLLRHAKSAWDDPTLRDRDRPLAPRGRKASKRVARWAKKHRVRPQLVVCSSAVRARQTLEGVLPGLGKPTVWVEVTLYAAGVDMLFARVRALPEEVDEAMLVGHNPGLMELLLRLAAPSRLRERAHENLPTGALAGLEMDVGRWADVSPGAARLTELVLPRSSSSASMLLCGFASSRLNHARQEPNCARGWKMAAEPCIMLPCRARCRFAFASGTATSGSPPWIPTTPARGDSEQYARCELGRAPSLHQIDCVVQVDFHVRREKHGRVLLVARPAKRHRTATHAPRLPRPHGVPRTAPPSYVPPFREGRSPLETLVSPWH